MSTEANRIVQKLWSYWTVLRERSINSRSPSCTPKLLRRWPRTRM